MMPKTIKKIIISKIRLFLIKEIWIINERIIKVTAETNKEGSLLIKLITNIKIDFYLGKKTRIYFTLLKIYPPFTAPHT